MRAHLVVGQEVALDAGRSDDDGADAAARGAVARECVPHLPTSVSGPQCATTCVVFTSLGALSDCLMLQIMHQPRLCQPWRLFIVLHSRSARAVSPTLMQGGPVDVNAPARRARAYSKTNSVLSRENAQNTTLVCRRWVEWHTRHDSGLAGPRHLVQEISQVACIHIIVQEVLWGPAPRAARRRRNPPRSCRGASSCRRSRRCTPTPTRLRTTHAPFAVLAHATHCFSQSYRSRD